MKLEWTRQKALYNTALARYHRWFPFYHDDWLTDEELKEYDSCGTACK